MGQRTDPTEVVREQLDAYNAKDMDAFMAPLAQGAAQIRERHVIRFRELNLLGQLISRMSVVNLVIDRQVVTRTFPEGSGRVDMIGIDEVSGAKSREPGSRWARRCSTGCR